MNGSGHERSDWWLHETPLHWESVLHSAILGILRRPSFWNGDHKPFDPTVYRHFWICDAWGTCYLSDLLLTSGSTLTREVHLKAVSVKSMPIWLHRCRCAFNVLVVDNSVASIFVFSYPFGPRYWRYHSIGFEVNQCLPREYRHSCVSRYKVHNCGWRKTIDLVRMADIYRVDALEWKWNKMWLIGSVSTTIIWTILSIVRSPCCISTGLVLKLKTPRGGCAAEDLVWTTFLADTLTSKYSSWWTWPLVLVKATYPLWIIQRWRIRRPPTRT